MPERSWSSELQWEDVVTAERPTPEPPREQQRPSMRAALNDSLSGGERTKVLLAVTVLVVLGSVYHVIAQRQPAEGFAEMGWSMRDASDTAPTPVRAESRDPLGTPLPVPADAGPYEFMAVQPGGGQPVTYDPCRPLRYVVNERQAPPGGEVVVAEAVSRVAQVTGLKFEYEGLTDETPAPDRPAHQPERYGDRWAPILIAWSDPTQHPELAGDVAGVGGSHAITTGAGGPAAFVSGVVALDTPQLISGPAAAIRGVVLHELAHVVGLAHVADPSQLMHELGRGTDFQPGDLAGLSQLGVGPCIGRL